jgi:hypothetical protein
MALINQEDVWKRISAKKTHQKIRGDVEMLGIKGYIALAKSIKFYVLNKKVFFTLDP